MEPVSLQSARPQAHAHAVAASQTDTAALQQPPRFHTTDVVTQLAQGGERTVLAGTVIDPALARKGDLLDASIYRDPTNRLAETIISIDRLLDSGALPGKERERIEIKLRTSGGTPEQRGAGFEKARAALAAYVADPERDIGKLISALRASGAALHELSATNANITLPNNPPLVLDGLCLKNCENVTIKAERTIEDRAKGRFYVAAHGLVIDGGAGSIALSGIDMSGAELKNVGNDKISYLRFNECQMRDTVVTDNARVGVLAATDCSFGSAIDLSKLEIKNGPQTLTDFKVLFGGTIWSADGQIQLHDSLGFGTHKEALEMIPSDRVPRLLLRPPSEAYLAHLLKRSSVLQATAYSSTQTEVPSGTSGLVVSVPGSQVFFSVTRDQHNKAVIDSVVVGAGASQQAVWKRAEDGSPVDTSALEDIISRLRNQKLRSEARMFSSKAFSQLKKDIRPEAIISSAAADDSLAVAA